MTVANASIYDLTATGINGQPVKLSDFKDKVLLIVNTASQCGFTPQYEGLQSLYEQFHSQGLEILGFPCNQFGQQEPGSPETIQSFCQTRFGVTFPLFDKVEVNGPNAHPLFKLLTKSAPGLLGTEAIKWNFTKFLVDRSGKIIKRYPSMTKPEDIAKDIQGLL